MLRLSAASFSLKKDNSLPAADTAILEQDVQLVNEIGSLLLRVLTD